LPELAARTRNLKPLSLPRFRPSSKLKPTWKLPSVKFVISKQLMAQFTIKKDLTSNVIGRKVMQTQDGKLVPMQHRDEQLIVETGMYRRNA
jgi:hypothetical protein